MKLLLLILFFSVSLFARLFSYYPPLTEEESLKLDIMMDIIQVYNSCSSDSISFVILPILLSSFLLKNYKFNFIASFMLIFLTIVSYYGIKNINFIPTYSELTHTLFFLTMSIVALYKFEDKGYNFVSYLFTITFILTFSYYVIYPNISLLLIFLIIMIYHIYTNIKNKTDILSFNLYISIIAMLYAKFLISNINFYLEYSKINNLNNLIFVTAVTLILLIIIYLNRKDSFSIVKMSFLYLVMVGTLFFSEQVCIDCGIKELKKNYNSEHYTKALNQILKEKRK